MFGRIADAGRSRQRVRRNSAVGDLSRGIQVLLHQNGGDGEDVPDVVEPKAGIVCGEVGGKSKMDGEQITNGVVVLDSIQAVGSEMARIGRGTAIRYGELILNPASDRRDRL